MKEELARWESSRQISGDVHLSITEIKAISSERVEGGGGSVDWIRRGFDSKYQWVIEGLDKQIEGRIEGKSGRSVRLMTL